MMNIHTNCHPLLARALSPEVLSPCRIASPPPIKIMALEKDYLGLCVPLDQTDAGEVWLSERLLDPGENFSDDAIREIYLHEAAHRLIGVDHGHDAAFLAMYAFLLLRLGEGIHSLRFYNLEGFKEGIFFTPGQALDWALAQAFSLVNKPVTAEQAAAAIRCRFANYGRSPGWLRSWGRVMLGVMILTGLWMCR